MRQKVAQSAAPLRLRPMQPGLGVVPWASLAMVGPLRSTMFRAQELRSGSRCGMQMVRSTCTLPLPRQVY